MTTGHFSQPLSEGRLMSLLQDKVDHPATIPELLQVLRVPKEYLVSFKRQIEKLVVDGQLVRIRGDRYGVPGRMNLVVGRVATHPRGFGFVVPDRPLDDVKGDVFIAGANLNQAIHGDRVVARIEHYRDGDRAEGRIVRILERGAAVLVGRYDVDESGLGFVVPFDRRVIMDVQIPRGGHAGAAPGQMVTVELTRWPTPTRGPLGRVREVLGDIDAPGVDTEIVIRKFGIPDAHGREATDEALRMGSSVRETDVSGRMDFRPQPTITIDGEDARDFDDAITLERLSNGHYWLGVHIADVAHYVQEGSALDQAAFQRGTSVYFPERAVHMFPSVLATGLCSLNPGVDRLVQSCLMEVDRHGNIVRYELHDGVIRSDARMTYTNVSAILTEHDPDQSRQHATIVPILELMAALFEALNHRRRRRGAIDFDLPAPEVILDRTGMVKDIIAAERNVAHRIIEEFMLLANETVAQHLESAGVPAVYRIHEPPDELKVDEFEEFISTLGYSLAAPPGAVRPRHFQRLIERISGKPEERPIAFLMLRTMQKARYDTANAGHFGLATSTYTHFTSPIRRYPDLLVHRILREVRQKGLDAARLEELAEELPDAARHASEMERRADEAERELVQWKKVRFMRDKVGETFEGYVTGVTAFGLFIELVEHFVEGLVHISTMADDYYRYVERAHVLRGENTHKVYRLGDKVNVQIVRVDPEQRQIDLGIVEILDAVRASERRRGPRRSRARPKRKREARPGRRERKVRKARK